jgi:hypothetical protein
VNAYTVSAAFGNYRIAAHSNAPEVIAGIEACYREMLEAKATKTVKTVKRLTVMKQGETYHVLDDGHITDETESLREVVANVNDQLVLGLIKASPGFLWLHAGAAATRDYALVFPGFSGQGKSTMVTRLCAQGWNYLSDDIVPLDLQTNKVSPFPLIPATRIFPGKSVSRHLVNELRKTVVSLRPEAICREARPIRALIFPNYYASAPVSLLRCSSSDAAIQLFQNCLNFAAHKEAAVKYICQLVQRVPVYRLTFGNAELATDLLLKTQKNWTDEQSREKNYAPNPEDTEFKGFEACTSERDPA